MPRHSAIASRCESAAELYAPGHLGELTQVIDPQLVDAVLEETGAREQRLRLLPTRVVVYDQIIAARGIRPDGPATLVGAIGRAALASLLPKTRRWRLKARVRKRAGKYTFTADKHPRKAQAYALHIEVIAEGDLDSPRTS